MFEGRLKILLYLLALGAILMVVRLAELQVARGSAYRETAERMLIRPIEYIPAVRGRILARNGEVLARAQTRARCP